MIVENFCYIHLCKRIVCFFCLNYLIGLANISQIINTKQSVSLSNYVSAVEHKNTKENLNTHFYDPENMAISEIFWPVVEAVF